MPGTLSERAWGIYAGFALVRPWLALSALGALVALAATQLGAVKFDASADTLVLERDRDLRYAREIASRYGGQPFMLAVWRPRDGELLSPENLERLDALRGRLAVVPGVASVFSVLDAPLLSSADVTLVDFGRGALPTLRTGGVDLERAREEFLSSPLYEELLVSADGRSTAVIVNLVPDARYDELLERRNALRERLAADEPGPGDARAARRAEAELREHVDRMTRQNSALVDGVRAAIDGFCADAEIHRIGAETAATGADGRAERTQRASPAPGAREDAGAFCAGAEMHLGGVPMIVADIIAFVKRDLSVFGFVILGLMTAVLAVVFRGAWRWTALPLLNCGVTAACVIGMFSWLDWRFSVMSANFFALLLILTLSISVHLVVRYRELHAESPWRSQRELVAEAARFMLRPCLFMTLTTLVAFASLAVSGIRPVIDFGQMMAIGVSAALAFTFWLLPAAMCALPKEERSNLSPPERALTRRLAAVADRRRAAVFAASGALALFGLSGIARLEVENRFIDYFGERTEIHRGMEVIDRDLGGTIPLDVVLRAPAGGAGPADAPPGGGEDAFADFDDSAKAPSAWFNRAGLERIAEVHDYLDGLDETGKVLSLATAHRVANLVIGEQASDVELEVMRRGLSRELSGILIDPYLSEADGEARLSVRVKETSRALRRDEWLGQVRAHLADELGFAPEDARLTGLLVLYNNMLQSLYSAQVLSLGAVFAAIMLMLAALFRSWRVAAVGIVPNALAALAALGVMGWFGIPLDMMTTTTAAIVVGIGVDNTIHYLYRFRHELAHRANDDYVQAMYRCHGSTGRAMHYTSATVALGLASLALSNFNPSALFGALTAAAMLLALLGTLLLLPPMLFAFRPFGDPSAERIGALASPRRR